MVHCFGSLVIIRMNYIAFNLLVNIHLENDEVIIMNSRLILVYIHPLTAIAANKAYQKQLY